MPIIPVTVNANDVFTAAFKPAGTFLVRITGTIGANTVRVQSSLDGSTGWENCSDGANGTIGLTAVGTYPINNPSTNLWYRVGCPDADFASGSFEVAVDHK